MRGAVLVLVASCTFTPGVAAQDASGDTDLGAHCLDGWCRRKPITIDGSQVSGSHDNFVALVRIASDPDLAANATGPDIRFVTSTGASLAYERESFDVATGRLLAWVRLPTLMAGANDTFYVYYGNTSATDQQDKVATWTPGYAGVWHLDEAAGSTMLADATGSASSAVAVNGPIVGGAASIGSGVSFDGVDDYLRVTQNASLMGTTGSATFALWIDWNHLTGSSYQRVLASVNRFTGGGDGYEWAADSGGQFFLYPWGGAEDYDLGPSPFTAGVWQYCVATLDYSTKTIAIYVDGVAMVFTVGYAPQNWKSLGMPGDWLWGSNIELSGPFKGQMDEIQVMPGVRSAEWVKTSYANQRSDSTLFAIGATQVLSP